MNLMIMTTAGLYQVYYSVETFKPTQDHSKLLLHLTGSMINCVSPNTNYTCGKQSAKGCVIQNMQFLCFSPSPLQVQQWGVFQVILSKKVRQFLWIKTITTDTNLVINQFKCVQHHIKSTLSHFTCPNRVLVCVKVCVTPITCTNPGLKYNTLHNKTIDIELIIE